MANKKNTRRALLLSVMSLILCCAMLVGTTFAWFTDTVTNSNNIIKSGKLDVTMGWADGTSDPASVTWKDASEGAIFNCNLWEPGRTEVRHIKIGNAGTLALKYQLHIMATGEVSKLADAIDVYFADPAVQVTARDNVTGLTKVGTLSEVLKGMPDNVSGKLESGKEATVTLLLKMQETAGNEYQNLGIGSDFSVVLSATQLTHEADSFGADYDTNTQYGDLPLHVSGSAPVVAGQTASYDIALFNTEGGKAGSVVVPAAAVAEDAKEIVPVIKETAVNSNVTIGSDKGATTYEIKVEGLKDNNNELVEVTINIEKGLTGVQVYHNEVLMDAANVSYNSNEGILKIWSKSFSPFTVVYDAEYVAPDLNDGMPTAEVTTLDVEEQNMYIIPDITAGFGGGSDIPVKPDVAYTFTATQTAEEVAVSAYKDWYVDYYVSMDQAVEDGLILVGCYGNWANGAWYGFNVPAGNYTEPVGLLGTMTGGVSNWTYQDIVNGVQEFSCGAYNSSENNKGKKMTVELRLIDPQNVSNMIVLNSISHTFQ